MSQRPVVLAAEIKIEGAVAQGQQQVLSPEALAFVADLARRFAPQIEQALERRESRRQRWARGEQLGFLPETSSVRAADWKVAALPADLMKRVVEITGP